MSDKCRKQARRWESGVKSHYEAEHRSPPMSCCSLCIAPLALLCLDVSITMRLAVYIGWDLYWGIVRVGKLILSHLLIYHCQLEFLMAQRERDSQPFQHQVNVKYVNVSHLCKMQKMQGIKWASYIFIKIITVEILQVSLIDMSTWWISVQLKWTEVTL